MRRNLFPAMDVVINVVLRRDSDAVQSIQTNIL